MNLDLYGQCTLNLTECLISLNQWHSGNFQKSNWLFIKGYLLKIGQ